MGHQLSEGGVQKERTATNSFNSSIMFHSFRSNLISLFYRFYHVYFGGHQKQRTMIMKSPKRPRQPPFRWLRGNSNGPSCRKVAPDPDILMENFGRWMLDMLTERRNQVDSWPVKTKALRSGTWMENGWSIDEDGNL